MRRADTYRSTVWRQSWTIEKNVGSDTPLQILYPLPYPWNPALTSEMRSSSYQVVGIAWAMHVGSDERIASWPRSLDIDGTSKQSLHVLDVFDRVAQDLDLRQSLCWSGRIGAGALFQRFECHVYLYASSSSSSSWSSMSSSNEPRWTAYVSPKGRLENACFAIVLLNFFLFR